MKDKDYRPRCLKVTDEDIRSMEPKELEGIINDLDMIINSSEILGFVRNNREDLLKALPKDSINKVIDYYTNLEFHLTAALIAKQAGYLEKAIDIAMKSTRPIMVAGSKLEASDEYKQEAYKLAIECAIERGDTRKAAGVCIMVKTLRGCEPDYLIEVAETVANAGLYEPASKFYKMAANNTKDKEQKDYFMKKSGELELKASLRGRT